MAPWAVFIGAFVFGLATGWLIWGGARAAAFARRGPEDGLAGGPDGKVPEAAIAAIEREIRAARALIDEADAQSADTVGELDALDASIKRANGRLKLLVRAVKKAGEA